jgi:damage-control phosphatase, subfamily I
MRISPECHGCLQGLAEQAAGYATDDLCLRNEARKRAEEILRERLKPGAVSIVVSTEVHDIIRQITGNPDPYRLTKDVEIEESRLLFEIVKDSYPEGFQDYLKLAAVGNSIDFFKPIEGVKKEIKKHGPEFTIDDSALLEEKVRKAGLVLYLADNAGEVFFDIPLLGLMRKHTSVVYVVKESPVQNDITAEEIRRAGVEKLVGEVMTTGTATPGIDFSRASTEFKNAFAKADFVFAKGMGYYETLEELPAEGRIFFCFKAKCRPVAASLNVPLDSYVAKLH